MAGKNEVQIIISAVDKASKVLKDTGFSLDGLGKIAKVAAATTAAAAVAIGVGMIKLAKDAAPVEGITSAFNGLTKSMEGGSKKILNSLKESSFGMVKQSDLMKSFNKAAQLVSLDFAKKMPDAMKYLSKVSAATGQDMDYMIESMVTGIGRLSPMILDNLGIQVDATQAYEDFAEANGLVASELSKTEQQTALMNQVMEKLAVNTKDMPEVAGSAAQSFAELNTKFADIKESIGIKLLPLFTTLTSSLSNWIDSKAGQASIDKFMGWIERVIGTADPPTGLTGIVSYLMSGNIKGAIDTAFGEGAYEKIQTFVDNFKIVMDDLMVIINGFITAVGIVIDLFDEAQARSAGTGYERMMGITPPRFASGGSFIVPGSGSGDRPYTIGLTPGERVDVTPKGQAKSNSNSIRVFGDLIVNSEGGLSQADILAGVRI